MANNLMFFVFAVVVVGTALGMVLSRNAIYSALFLVMNFAVVALLYVQLGAPFIAMAQVTVYAGAIMILFLFVIMLLGAEQLSEEEPLPGQRVAALLLGTVFIVAATVLIVVQAGPSTPLPAPEASFASPMEVGTALFTKYTLPFEVVSAILLVAMIGAIVLTRTDRPRQSLTGAEKKE
jgi:NADH-quinone oxidoreductase subunit J